MSARTECAAKAASAAASDFAASMESIRVGGAQAARQNAATRKTGVRDEFPVTEAPPRKLVPDTRFLQNISRQVLALRELAQAGIHVGGVQRDAALRLSRVERDLLEELLHHGVQAPRADVLGRLVHRERDLGEAPHAFVGVDELGALGGEQSLVLLGEAGVGRG